MIEFIAGMQKILAGKKTHILVLIAVVLTLFGVDTADGGISMSLEAIDLDRLQIAVKEAGVSAVKAAWDRKQTG